MSRNVDPRVPTQLTQREVNDLKIRLLLSFAIVAIYFPKKHKDSTRLSKELKNWELTVIRYMAAQFDLERTKTSLRRSILKKNTDHISSTE